MSNPYNTPNYTEQGGARTVVGGSLDVASGGEIDIESGGALKIAGVAITATAADLNGLPPAGVTGVAASYKLARGQTTVGSASDTVVSGLTTIVAVVASLNDDPVDGCQFVSASIGNQAGAPAAGSFYLKTWKAVDGDATLVAATTASKKVNWIAIGT
jgi:hypothetical protein